MAADWAREPGAAWLEAFIRRKSLTRETGRYFAFQSLKTVRTDGRPEYRTFHAASPSTALFEAWALQELAGADAFRPHPCVYSYQWPHVRGSRSYRYFVEGFSQRDRSIRNHLRADPSLCVVVRDVENFYGSIQKQPARSAIEARLSSARSILADNREAIVAILERFMAATPGRQGIAIGPAFSHVVAQAVLSPLDVAMAAAFGDKYHRYVDDILVVCPRNEVERVDAILTAELGRVGLVSKREKADILSSTHWLHEARRLQQPDARGTFSSLVNRVVAFLGNNPTQFDELKRSFTAAGVWLPLERLRSQSRYSRGARFLRWTLGGYFWFRGRTDSVSVLCQEALRLRSVHRESLARAQDRAIDRSPTRRRWRLQEMRYELNRLLYLTPVEEYGPLLSSLRGEAGFSDLAAVVRALETGDVEPLLDMPGTPVMAFAGLRASQKAGALTLGVSSDVSAAVADSLAALALYGLWRGDLEAAGGESDRNKRLLSYAVGSSRGVAPPARVHVADPYIDELAALSFSPRMANSGAILSSRFDDEEEVVLEALWLGPDASS